MPKCVKIIECPRDAMQGIKTFIPTKKKIQYLQSLLRVGFDTIDFGSFVSPRAIPQMQVSRASQNLHQRCNFLDATTKELLGLVASGIQHQGMILVIP